MRELNAIIEMQKIEDGDTEMAHIEAEAIILQFLRDSGHELLADSFEETKNRIGFWYV